jgi:hypothetical protein
MLTTDQLTAIDRHLRKDNWLLNEELIAELTDHYANAVMDAMGQGSSFDQAINDVHKTFGGRKGLLAMEETYQTEKAKQIDVYVWREVRRMVEGDRWPLVIGIFGILFGLNTYLNAADSVESFLSIAMWYVGFTVLLAMVTSVIYLVKKDVSSAVTQATPKVFIWGYLLGLGLITINKYLFPYWQIALSTEAIMLVNTLLGTLCITYYIAVILGLRTFFFPNHRAAKNA